VLRLNMNVLPGEPLDGSGKICIHLFVQDESGPFIEPHVLYDNTAGPKRGRLVCDPLRKVAPVSRDGVTTITPRTDDPRATTCPKCKASKEYQDLVRILAQG
jgi:hypothetical protein